MTRQLSEQPSVFGLKLWALRGADADASVTLAEALQPPNGNESERPTGESEYRIRGTHSFHGFEMDGKRILVDAGYQPAVVERSLEHAGLSPNSIDLILLTHGDHDHFAGLLDLNGELRFPNATVVMSELLWQSWSTGGAEGDTGAFYADEQRADAKRLVPLLEDRIVTVDTEASVLPGIRVQPSPGHRASHLSYEIDAPSGRVLFFGDAIIFPEVFKDLSRGINFDSDPEVGIATRQSLIEQASQPNTAFVAPHFPFPGIFSVSETDSGLSWTAWES